MPRHVPPGHSLPHGTKRRPDTLCLTRHYAPHLRPQARELEFSLREKDEELASIMQRTGRGGGRGGGGSAWGGSYGSAEEAEQLALRVSQLQAANSELMAASAQKAQLLSQAKAFLQSRAEGLRVDDGDLP